MKAGMAGSSLQTDKTRPGIRIALIVTSTELPGCVILGKRKGIVGSGLYQLPGSHLNYGESWEDAAFRAVGEETGMHVADVKYCFVTNSIVPEVDYHYVTIFLKAELGCCGPLEPQNTKPNENEGWQWIKWNDMPKGNKLFYPLRDFMATRINPFQN